MTTRFSKLTVLFLMAFLLLVPGAGSVMAQDQLSAPQADTLLNPDAPSVSMTPPVTSAVPSTMDTMNAPYDPKKLPQSLSLGSGPNREKIDKKEIDPEDIPEILLQEMKEIETRCEGNYFYSSFHDCRCVAVKFLDERMKSDPATMQFIIFDRVSAQCPDKTAIAGFVYRSCYDMMKRDRPDFVDFCECSAKNIAERYAERPQINMSYIEDLRKQAFRECGALHNNTYRAPSQLR